MKSFFVRCNETVGLQLISAKDGTVMFSRTAAQIRALGTLAQAEAALKALVNALHTSMPGASLFDLHIISLSPLNVAHIHAVNQIPAGWVARALASG